MTYNQLLEYCYFYKGEVICPKEFDKKNEGELWFAEKMICEDLSELVDDANPRVSFAQAVASYVGKWDPYSLYEVMEPTSKSALNYVLSSYNCTYANVYQLRKISIFSIQDDENILLFSYMSVYTFH